MKDNYIPTVGNPEKGLDKLIYKIPAGKTLDIWFEDGTVESISGPRDYEPPLKNITTVILHDLPLPTPYIPRS